MMHVFFQKKKAKRAGKTRYGALETESSNYYHVLYHPELMLAIYLHPHLHNAGKHIHKEPRNKHREPWSW